MLPATELRADLERRFGLHALPLSRAATGLYLLAKVLGLEGRKVLTGATICNSPVNALALAGCGLEFADAAITDFNPDPQSLEQALTPDCAAILAADVFGHVNARPELYRFAQDNGLMVIEDLAQSVLSHLPSGLPTGLKQAVLSFGQGKPISATLGGAILADDPRVVAEAEALYDRLSELAREDCARLQGDFRAAYYRLPEAERPEHYASLRHEFQDLYIFRRPEREDYREALQALAGLPEQRRIRLEKAARFTQGLGGLAKVLLPRLAPGCAPYRFTFLALDRRDEFVAALRAQGLHASTLYPDVRDQQWRDRELPVTRRIEREVVNLWIDSCVDNNYIAKVLHIAEQMLA